MELYQGRIEPPKAARGHIIIAHVITAVLLKITFPVKHVKLRARYGYGRSTELIPGQEDECGTETPSKPSPKYFF